MNWQDLVLTANFPAEISCEEISRSETRITLRWEKQPYDAPALCVTWKTALKDIQYEWYPLCGRDRALRTDWDAPIHTSFSTGAPVFCFYNEEGQNRLTIALSEVRLETLHSYGVHEEDGNLLCRLEVPLPMTSSAAQYSVTLLRLREDVRYETALRQVADWWEQHCATSPMPVPEAARQPLYSTWYSFHQQTVAADLEETCALAAADGFVESFPDKYETYIEQGGTNVSGGQKQRLCIARALLKNPKILILDDSTSAVDTKTDAEIRKSFREYIPDVTKIIIAQRISSVQDADKIIVMDNGEISAVGTHEELLKTSEIYKEVYYSQVKGAGEDAE